MSKYTTELRFICESYAGLTASSGFNDVENIIAKARPLIFNFNYPIFDENYRPILETKILMHYYTNEICCETVGLWKLYLKSRLYDIMPYYNQLYQSTMLKFDVFNDVNYTTKNNREITSQDKYDNTTTSQSSLDKEKSENSTRTDNLKTIQNKNTQRTDDLEEHIRDENTRTDDLQTSSTGTNTKTNDLLQTVTENDDSNNKDKYSDTPQGSLGNIENMQYLTNARIIDTTTNKSKTTKDTGTISNSGTTTDTQTGTVDNLRNLIQTNTGTQDISDNTSIDNTGTQTNEVTSTDNQITTGKFTNNSNRNITNLDEFTETVSGKKNPISNSTLLIEYRKTFLNIDLEIIENLSDLFMGLW